MERERQASKPPRSTPPAAPARPAATAATPWDAFWNSPPLRSIRGVFGLLLALFSAFLVVTFAVELVTGTGDTEPGILAGLIVFFLGTGIGGALMVRSNLLPRRLAGAPARESAEQRILRFAAVEHGRVTVAEVAAACQLDLESAKRELDRLVVEEAATMEVTDDGVLVYAIRGFLSDSEKEAASEL